MNSALQCLSNTAPLTEYFVKTEAGYKPYLKHINKDNPLGMGGAIAEAYGTLLDEIWEGSVSVTAPRHFKTQVGRYAPQFVGYAQHDSQELLAFLLDGLHEDLNLVKKKPYVDMTVETKDRKETDIAEETWYKYLQRNQSVIVKLFQGQLRSTLVCPQCDQVSKTFDPFMFLSLPLPIKKTRTIIVYLVRSDPKEPITKYKLKLPKRGCVGDLKEELGRLGVVKATHLAVVDVYNSRFHRIYSDRDPLSHIMDRILEGQARCAGGLPSEWTGPPWYNFDDIVVATNQRSVLDRSLGQSFAEEGKQLKAKYHGGNKEEGDDQDKTVFREDEETQPTSTPMDETD